LLYVVDASDPTCEAQLEVTRSVLREIGAGAVPSMLLLNKADRIEPRAREALLEMHSGAMVLSAHDPNDIAALRQSIIDFFETSMVDEELIVPYAKQGLIGEVYESARVLSEDYDERGTRLRVRALGPAIARLRRSFAE
jgi:GTP-binding protein HflX